MSAGDRISFDRAAMCLDHAPFTPFMEPRTARPPGLSPLNISEWLMVDAAYAPQMAYRQWLRENRADQVCLTTTPAEPGLKELQALVLDNLPAGFDGAATGVRRPDGAVVPRTGDPLTVIGDLCQEDFCLLARSEDEAEYRLTAALLCFPSRWSLAEKIGRPLTDIHGPVPYYEAELSRRVNRVFDTLRADRPLVRINWLVHPTNELFLALGESDKLMDEAREAENLWLRTERQALLRLPETGDIVFSIRTTITPLERLTSDQRKGLREALAEWSADSIRYHGGAHLHGAAMVALAG